MRHAAGEFRNVHDEGVVLLTPPDDHFVVVVLHQSTKNAPSEISSLIESERPAASSFNLKVCTPGERSATRSVLPPMALSSREAFGVWTPSRLNLTVPCFA